MPKHSKRLQRLLLATAQLSSLVHQYRTIPLPELNTKLGQAMEAVTAAYDSYVDPDRPGIA